MYLLLKMASAASKRTCTHLLSADACLESAYYCWVLKSEANERTVVGMRTNETDQNECIRITLTKVNMN